MSSNETEPTGAPARTARARQRNVPPPGQRWKRGQSGNPAGSSKALAEVRSLARQYGPEAVECLVKLMRASKSPRVRLAAAKEILDRGFGRPPIEVSGPGGSPIPLAVHAGAAITTAVEAEQAYRAILGGELDADSVVFAMPPQAVAQRPVAIEAPIARDAELIVAPARPGEDPTLPQLKPDYTVGAWQRLAK